MANQVFENCEHVLPVLHYFLKDRTKLRSTHGFFIPLRQYGGWDLYVAAQFVGRMAAQK